LLTEVRADDEIQLVDSLLDIVELLAELPRRVWSEPVIATAAGEKLAH
jgi:hypothetical protein